MLINIALAQAALDLGEPESNYRKIRQMAEAAAQAGADLILLPELWASGYDLDQCQKYASPLGEGWFARMQAMAAEIRIAVGGSLIESERDEFFNTFACYDADGSLLGAYRKIHLFQLLKEEDHFSGGTDLVNFGYKSSRLGLATCYDLRFPELFRAQAAAGVELILIAAEWPARRIQHWNILLQARAIENQCFIAAVNKSGLSRDEKLGGCSSVVGPMGEILIQGGEGEDLLLATVDLGQVKKIRRWMPVLNDRKPDLYQKFYQP